MYCKHCGNEVKQGQKFCGKCGRQFASDATESTDQSSSKPFTDRGGQDKKGPGERSKRNVAIAIGACFVLAIALGAVYLATNSGQKKPDNDIGSTLAMMTETNGGELPEITYNDADNMPSFISGRFSNRSILDDEDARLAIGDVSALFGDDSIAENLELFNKSEFDGIKFYRFKQLHQGYEVFGRQLILAADAEGSAFSLNGQYEMIDSLQTDIDIEESQAWNRASEQDDDVPIRSRGIVAYVSKGAGVLAWEIECEESIKLISARDGSLLCSVPIAYDGAGVDKAHGAKDAIQFNTEIDEDGKYVLLDKTRNISYHNADGKKVNPSYEIVNENWDVLFTYGTGQSGIRDVSDGSLISFDAYNATVTGTECRLCDLGPDGARRISVANCYTDNPDAGVPFYADDDNEWKDKYILNAVGAINKAYDFYLKLGWKGLNGHNHPLRVYANDARESDDSGNASASANGYISIGKDNDAEYEFLAHEYTHLVLFGMANLGMTDNPGAETKALHEAYSDIMAIISNRDDKWSWADNTRNLADPAKNDQKKESGQHLSLYSPDNMQEEEHLDSTVIGHAAYLMYERGLSFDDLEKLWFGSMHFLDPSSDFYTCRYAVLASARGLGFGSAKTEIIKSAFDDANIRRFDVSSMSVAPNGKIYAEDHNGDRITNFTVELRYAGSEFGNLRGSVAYSAKTDDGCIDMSSAFGGEPLVGYYFIDVHAEGAAQEYGPVIHVDTNGASELVITLPVLVVYLSQHTDNQRYESYLKKIEEYQSQFGEGKIETANHGNVKQMKGLCLVDLLDFDNDGDEELLLGYYDESQANYYSSDNFADAQAYRAEIWGYENGGIDKLYESDFQWTNGGFAYLPIYKRSGDVAMYTVEYSTDSDNRSVGANGIWVLRGDAFEEITTFSTYGMWGTGEVEYEIDGKKVDENAYKTHFDDVMGDHTTTSYWMTWNDSSSHEAERWDTLNTPADTLIITKDTIAKLRGEQVVDHSQQGANAGVFADKIHELVSAYGEPSVATYTDKHPNGDASYTYSGVTVQAEGLCYAKLVDFDRDGTDELLTICYDPTYPSNAGCKHEQMGPEENMYRVDIWGSTGEGLIQLSSHNLTPYDAGIGAYLYKTDAYCALQTCNYDAKGNTETFDLLTFENDLAKDLTEWGRKSAYYAMNTSYFVDGANVEESVYRIHPIDFLGSYTFTLIEPIVSKNRQAADTSQDLFASATSYEVLEPEQAVETAKKTISEIESSTK